MLSEGWQLWQGPPQAVLPWFARLGYAQTDAAAENAPDWLMDLVSVGFAKPATAARSCFRNDMVTVGRVFMTCISA